MWSRLPIKNAYGRFRTWLTREVDALPVDAFRVLSGVLIFCYFCTLLYQADNFSNPDGLLDHELLQRIYWFTRMGLFHPGLPLWVFYAAFSFGCMGAVAIVLGYRTRLFAFALYLIAVSTYRWNFIVMFVDDSFMHLLLFWLMLLPTGSTLTLREYRRHGSKVWEKWLQSRVSGTAVRCFIGNAVLVYLVAGLWKFESPLWHRGFALYASMRLPIAWAPDMWGPEDLWFLKICNYYALIIEPVIPVLLLLRPRHILKYFGAIAQVTFHLGIIFTLRVPYANIALIASLVLFFRTEIMDGLRAMWARKGGVAIKPLQFRSAKRLDGRGRIALILLIVLTVAMMRRLPVIDDIHKPAYAILWVAGLAQDYQLFNWIDKKNWRSDHQVVAESLEEPPEILDPEMMFPKSIRMMLLQSYIYDLRWIPMHRQARPIFKRKTRDRMANRFCRKYPTDKVISVESTLQRILPSNMDLKKGQPRYLMTFECVEGRGRILPQNWKDRRGR